MLAGVEEPDRGHVTRGTGARVGYFAQQHDALDFSESVWMNAVRAAPDVADRELRTVLGTFLLSGDQLGQSAGSLSGGERTRLALAALVSSRANLLLLDEPTNNLDPDSRQQVLTALRSYEGAVVLVSHDRGAVEALQPDRVIILPEATEDFFSEEYLDLVSVT
jgi:ATPase subunit of ABC transporter with duplicated ATPase domains